jgi:hypothetical protein
VRVDEVLAVYMHDMEHAVLAQREICSRVFDVNSRICTEEDVFASFLCMRAGIAGLLSATISADGVPCLTRYWSISKVSLVIIKPRKRAVIEYTCSM